MDLKEIINWAKKKDMGNIIGLMEVYIKVIGLINKHKNDILEIRASGGIRDIHTMEDMINAGATRIGTSSGVEIMNHKCDCCKEEK